MSCCDLKHVTQLSVVLFFCERKTDLHATILRSPYIVQLTPLEISMNKGEPSLLIFAPSVT